MRLLESQTTLTDCLWGCLSQALVKIAIATETFQNAIMSTVMQLKYRRDIKAWRITCEDALRRCIIDFSTIIKRDAVLLSSPFIGNRRLCNPLIISSALPISLQLNLLFCKCCASLIDKNQCAPYTALYALSKHFTNEILPILIARTRPKNN